MFSQKDGWIRFQERPLICVDPQHRIASSGCGHTEFSDSNAAQPRMKDRIRFTHYKPASHWVSETAARVVLQGSHTSQGVILHLAMDGDACTLRLDGLPWDHNRIIYHIAQPNEENVEGGFSTLQASKTGWNGETWSSGTRIVWAVRGRMHPVSGYCTTGGFWLRSESPSLVRFHIKDGKPGMDGMTENRMEIWDARAILRVGLAANGESAKTCLLDRSPHASPAIAEQKADMAKRMVQSGENRPMAVLESAAGLSAVYPDFLKLSGGIDICEKTAAKLASEGRCPLLVLEDWQGMRRTLVSATSGCSWRPDPEQYHRLPELVVKLRTRGFSCALNILPYLDMDSELFREAAVRGYCLTARNGRIHEDKVRENAVAWIDLTQPKAVAWIQEQMRSLVEAQGVDALVAEVDMPFPAKASAQGGTVAELRNRWATWWLDACLAAFEPTSGICVVPGEWAASPAAKAASVSTGGRE